MFIQIEMRFRSDWITLAVIEGSRDDAEWIVGLWKQEHRMFEDPFRYTLLESSLPSTSEDKQKLLENEP